MAITISGENNNDRITAQDGVIDTISGFNIAGIITASSFTGDLTGDVTGNVTGNINNSTLLLQTGSTERLRITSGGFLGIGAGAATNKPLHIYTGSSDSEIRLQTNSGTEHNSYMSLRHSTGDLDFYTVQSGTNMKFHTVNIERLRITAGGAVLLGATTTSNLEQFRIHTQDSGKAIIKLTNSTTGTGTGDGFEFGMNGSEQIEFVNKENTDMFFATNNAERLRIESGGDVDIKSGVIKLASGANRRLMYRAGNNDVILEADNGDFYRQDIANSTHEFFTGNTERLRIDSDGDVIIGTSSWQYKKPLNVQGSSGHILSLYNADTTTYAANTLSGIELKLLTGNTGNQFGSCEIRAFKENGTNGDNARALSFYTGVNGGVPNERLRITSDGKIGVGIDSPATKFHFQGGELTIKSSGESGPYLFRNNGSGPDLVFHSGRGSSFSSPTASGGTDLLGNINFAGYDGSNYLRRASINGVIDGSVSSGNVPTAIYFRTGSTAAQERLRIKPNGNVEIGTVTDAGDTLRYFDIANYNTGNSAGVVQRMLTRKSDGTSVAGLDIVKYKAGGAYLINYETIGSNGFIAFSTGENAGSPIERLRIHGSGAVTKPYQYVFMVSTTNHSKTANWGQITNMGIVTAQCTGVSEGTYWSNSTQRFTAPVTGLYYFYVGGWSYGNSNGARYAYTFKHQNGNNYDYISGGNYCLVDSPMDGWSRTIKLSAGEWVELWGYSAIAVRWGGGHRFYWGGYLLG